MPPIRRLCKRTSRQQATTISRALVTKTIATRLTPDELAEVESAAEQAGKPLSEWLRESALTSARQRPADRTELVLAELWAVRHVLLNLFYAAAQASTEGAPMSPSPSSRFVIGPMHASSRKRAECSPSS
jgi:hypothetical protein